MKFTYTYRSSDGQRHTAEIEAESRDAAFAKVRSELGIKPIKVVAAGDHATGKGSGKSASSPRWGVVTVIALIAAILLIALAVWWFGGRGATAPAQEPSAYTVNTPQGPVTLRVAEPLPRQMIPGDRRRIEGAVNGQDALSPSEAKSQSTNGVFKFAAEAWLARYAEPGRPPLRTLETSPATLAQNEGVSLPRKAASPRGSGAPAASQMGMSPERPSEADFTACLKEPIRIASTDFTEVVDLKRIVSGMKREMRAYLAGGGTVDGYLAELEKRQRLEISYRKSAEEKLESLLKDPKAAYAYWLKANAQLQAMGIYPLALPDALRTYQMSLDIEE